MTGLTVAEQRLFEPIGSTPMLEQMLAWATVNSGSGNLAGLADMATRLEQAFAVLPGQVELVNPAPVTAIGANGHEVAVENGRHLVLRVRPDAARRVLLTVIHEHMSRRTHARTTNADKSGHVRTSVQRSSPELGSAQHA